MGREHIQEVSLAKKTHPMVIHFDEVHQGRQQEILMRIVKTARTALECQTLEIDLLTASHPSCCLNLKNEWGQSKNPSLVTRQRHRDREEKVPGKRSQ